MGKGASSSAPGGPTAPPAPAASQSSLEATQAKIDTAKQVKGKKGINSTILTGQQPLGTDPADPDAKSNPLAGGSTLLGGG